MPVQYRKLYAKQGVVAYGRVDVVCDHLFLWAASTGADTFDTLAELVAHWSQATGEGGGPARRSILFCQVFDLAGLGTALDRLVASPVLAACWGRLSYWGESVFTGGAFDSSFPTGTATPVLIGAMALNLDVGTVPQTLDDFTITLGPTGANLALALTASPAARWSIDGATVTGELEVGLEPLGGFVAGSIGVSIPWASGGNDAHPLQRATFTYVAAPTVMPGPGDDPVSVRVWAAQFADKVVASTGSGATSRVFLDPRDSRSAPAWLRGELNSRVLFGDALIHSSFYAAEGSRFVLRAGDGAALRLGFRYDLMDSAGTMSSSDDVMLHPEGLFEITSPAGRAPSDPLTALNISSRDLVAGSAATEFFDLSGAGGTAGVTHIEFVKRQPAFFLEGESGPPTTRTLLDDRGGVVVTSHVRFSSGGVTVSAPFHSQPAEAPLFESSGTTASDPLRRRRVPFGAGQTSTPVFPRAGYSPADDAADGELPRFETTHLAQYRRNKVRGTAPGVRSFSATASATLAVTPQGLLAQVASDGTYSALYFGNPDSQTERDEFCLTISNPTSTLYSQLQQALAGHQLFMVLHNPTSEALSVLALSATLHARGFAFSVGVGGAAAHATSAMGASVFLVKYFNDKSLADLVRDPRLWALQEALAPEGPTGIKRFTTPEYLKPLEAIWSDPNWQGVLALDLSIASMPDLLEALRPGLSGVTDSHPYGDLRVHHFGLNALPTRKDDLGTASPRRPGSAFGLIEYVKQSDVPRPTKGDVEPGASDDPNRQYTFVVESLGIGFQNSQISSFQTKVTVAFSHLFWDAITAPAGGDLPSLELDGFYERRPMPDGSQQDVFSLTTPDTLTLSFGASSYLKQLAIAKAQLNVVSADRSGGALQRLTVFIGLDATLTFSEKLDRLPLFTVKSIRLWDFGFQFVYTPAPNVSFAFGFKSGGVSADIDFDKGASSSLLSSLPVKLKGMTVAVDKLLDLKDINFQPLAFDGIGTKLHFGFLMELDLGSLGNLAGGLGNLRIPLVLGWAGGSNPGLALGIQFPGMSGKLDIGIQQFIRLQADELNVVRCLDTVSNDLIAVAIQAVNARVVMLGHAWPDADVAIAIFIPVGSDRRPSWAFGLANGNWYVGGGYRIQIAGSQARSIQAIVDAFRNTLSDIDKKKSVCQLVGSGIAKPALDEWSIAARYSGAITVAVAISDPDLYGVEVNVPPLGALDLLYRRVDGQVGIFSVEYTLPGLIRTMQFGVATVRLPVFRLEVHTDGGFLADVGYPWNNDFSRSCQVEVAIFLGSGGFYFGRTSAAAADLLHFDGGYGYLPPDDAALDRISTLRLGFALRVGIGRSLTIGILSASASITVFGSLEGAAGYRAGADFFSPTLYALKGFVGLMVDIQASVDFAIIKASARIIIYAEVGLEIRRVMAKGPDSAHYLLTLPVVIFAEVGISVSVTVEIHIGCVSISISLSFSATWRLEETLGPLSVSGPVALLASAQRLVAATPPNWETAYKYWPTPRELKIYATVLPCMANAADMGETGGPKSCAVGTMLLSAGATDNGLADLVRFLLGWLLLPSSVLTGDLASRDNYRITLKTVADLQEQIATTDSAFWTGFPAAVLTVTANQFSPKLSLLALNQEEPLAVMPPWPGSTFAYVATDGTRVSRAPSVVAKQMIPMSAVDVAFAEYCQHIIAGTMPEVKTLLQDAGVVPKPDGTLETNLPVNDPRKSLSWSQIWTHMFEAL